MILLSMIKTTILVAIILFLGTMMVQEVYAGGITGGVVAGVVISEAIPDWVKTQFEWYVNGEIDEKTLLTSMNWMFDNNVMYLSEKAAIEVQQMKEENNDLKIQVEELQAAIAIPNLIEARKGANESADTGSGGDITMQGGSGGAGDASTTDEFGKVKVQFHWGSTQEDIDQYIDEMKKSIGYLPPEQQSQAISSLRTLVSSEAIHDSGTSSQNTIVGYQAGETADDGSFSFQVQVSSFASDTVDDIMTKGGTISAWEDGIATFSDMGYKYVPPYTTSESSLYVENRLDGEMVSMAMYTVIEKESQIIDAELKIVEQWLDIIEEKHTTDTSGTSTDYYGRTTTETGTTNYNESDLNFISRILESSDQKIMSLQTGLTVLEQKLQTAGDDAALANIDLQNMLQKQQQTLQTMSNVSKMLHDTAMSVIQKIG